MLSRFNVRLLAIFTVLLALTQANLFGVQKRDELAPRQLLSDLTSRATNLPGSSPSSPAASSPTSKPATITSPTSRQSSTSVEDPTTKPSSTPVSSTPIPTSNTDVSTTPPPTSDQSKTPDTPTSPATSSQPNSNTKNTSKTTSSVSLSQTVIVVKQTTTIDGVVKETEYSSTSIMPVPTGSESKVDNGSETTNKGMTSQTKKTVVGVVVGIVGAIVLGALFFVAWRIWGRKKSEDEGDDLMGDYHGRSAHEKISDVGTAAPSPFQTTLDQYHNPNGRNANVSSNF